MTTTEPQNTTEVLQTSTEVSQTATEPEIQSITEATVTKPTQVNLIKVEEMKTTEDGILEILRPEKKKRKISEARLKALEKARKSKASRRAVRTAKKEIAGETPTEPLAVIPEEIVVSPQGGFFSKYLNFSGASTWVMYGVGALFLVGFGITASKQLKRTKDETSKRAQLQRPVMAQNSYSSGFGGGISLRL